jgi:hypothetical protein
MDLPAPVASTTGDGVDQPTRLVGRQRECFGSRRQCQCVRLDGIDQHQQIEAPAALLAAYSAFRGRVSREIRRIVGVRIPQGQSRLPRTNRCPAN